MFSDDLLLPISALQHLRFCERQWGLIHLEQQWEENRLTAEGRVLHDRVHDTGSESRPGILITRTLPLRSHRLGLTGQADAVEFHAAAPNSEPPGISLPGRPGLWRAFPVEYKRGKPKPDACDEVQLCAQALCLEEMLHTSIPAGALFYGTTRRRTDVPFDLHLRALTEDLARRMHQLWATRVTPPAVYSKKCDNCSLYNRCLPRAASKHAAVQRYLASGIRAALAANTEPTT